MIGKIIKEERLNKNIKLSDLAKAVDIDSGFLTHIEKGERNPSRTVLSRICKELNLSYDFMLSLLENSLGETSAEYDVTKYTPAKKVLYAENLLLMDYPESNESISFITKMIDTSMEPQISKDDLILVKYTSLIEDGDICIAELNGKLIIRRFCNSRSGIKLQATNKSFKTISINNKTDSLNIIGKIIIN